MGKRKITLLIIALLLAGVAIRAKAEDPLAGTTRFINNVVIGKNGYSIELPADGFVMCGNTENGAYNTMGFYFSKTPSYKSDFYWTLIFSIENEKVVILENADCWKKSVRLVKNL